MSLDAELGFVEDHFTVMAVLRDAIAGMVEAVREHAAGAVEHLGVELPGVPAEIPHLHFRDALRMLAEETGENLSGEADLAPAHERAICDWARDTHGSEFAFVTGYPMSKRPFYTHPDPADPTYSSGSGTGDAGIDWDGSPGETVTVMADEMPAETTSSVALSAATVAATSLALPAAPARRDSSESPSPAAASTAERGGSNGSVTTEPPIAAAAPTSQTSPLPGAVFSRGVVIDIIGSPSGVPGRWATSPPPTAEITRRE